MTIPNVPENRRDVIGKAPFGYRVNRASMRKLLKQKEWWLGPESNRGHEDFQSSALPTELPSPKSERLDCQKFRGTQAVSALCRRKI